MVTLSERMDALAKRRSVRLSAYDYASHGAYFVTIVSEDRRCLFGDIGDDYGFAPSPLGVVVAEEWRATEVLRQNVELDEFVVMPNHVHGIIWIINADGGNAGRERRFGISVPGSLSSIVNAFKGAVTRRARTELGIERIWQRGFYEHVIRSEKALGAIRQYIIDNPRMWAEDEENPAKAKRR